MQSADRRYQWLSARLLMRGLPVSLTTIWQFIAAEVYSKLDSARVPGVKIVVNTVYDGCGICSKGAPPGIGCSTKP